MQELPKETPGKASEPSIQTITSRLGGTIHVHYDAAIARSMSHKTRTFGQSSWVVSAIHMVMPSSAYP